MRQRSADSLVRALQLLATRGADCPPSFCRFGAWDSVFLWSLELGVWSFSGCWMLDIGISSVPPLHCREQKSHGASFKDSDGEGPDLHGQIALDVEYPAASGGISEAIQAHGNGHDRVCFVQPGFLAGVSQVD